MEDIIPHGIKPVATYGMLRKACYVGLIVFNKFYLITCDQAVSITKSHYMIYYFASLAHLGVFFFIGSNVCASFIIHIVDWITNR